MPVSKYVDMIGWDDAPHLKPPHISEAELADAEKNMQPHQRQARRSGRPSLGAGAIYPVDEDDLFVEPFRVPPHFERAWALDVGWVRTGALWGARDPDADVYYLTHEYYRGEHAPIVHAHAIKTTHPWPGLEGAIDPAAEGSNIKDGTKLRAEYEELGLRLRPAVNAVSAGIHHVLTLMQGGQLKVFTTLTSWRKEFRLYRRDEKGKIVKKNDHLMDCTRYLLMTSGLFVTQPTQRARSRGRGEW